MRLRHSGKIRDVYSDGDDVILVASDKVSVYDVVLPTPIADKGKLLTQLSVWWFDQLSDVVGNHLISATDVPDEFRGRAMRCQRLDMVAVECIARGYLSGSGWQEYQKHGTVSGVRLPAGLEEGSRLPEPIFTPTTKAVLGEHDVAITFDDVVTMLGRQTAQWLQDTTLRVYERGAQLAASRGIIIADTKLEFGRADGGDMLLGDEVLTSDSSRFWPAERWSPGGPQPSFDKQFVRDWATATGWDKTPPAPEVPDDIVAATRQRYVAAYEQLTGRQWN